MRRLLVLLGLTAAIAAAGYGFWRWQLAAPGTASSSNASAAGAPAAPPPTVSETAPTSPAAAEAALAPEPAVPAPLAPTTSIAIAGDGGTIDATLSLAVTGTHEPVTPAQEFDEQSPAVYASLKSSLPGNAVVNILWRRLTNPDGAPADDIIDTSVSIPAQQARSFALKKPRDGFFPGDYEFVMSIGNINPQTLPFRITSKYEPARVIVASEGLPGLNAALAALGGEVVSASDQRPADRWAAKTLIDGFSFLLGGSGACSACGWSSSGQPAPYELVFKLAGDRDVRIDRVVIDPATEDTTKEQVRLIPRNVEIEVSRTSATDGFTPVASARVLPRPVEQLVRFPAAPARFLKLRVLSNWGGNTTQMGELKILEADGPSALAEVPRNIALPALGGVVARFTSQNGVNEGVQHVLDGELGPPWQSDDKYLPQDFVFAFKDDQVARIDRVVINPHGRAPATWPKTVLLSVSNDSLFEFEDIGQFTLPQEDRDHELKVGREARFLRVRILENHGAGETTLNEIRIFESTAAGYTSVLARTLPTTAGVLAAAPGAAATHADAEERESNNDPAAANPLAAGKSIGGAVDPPGDLDHFGITIPGTGRQVLTLGLTGQPYIKTSVTMVDGSGQAIRRFDPAAAPGTEATITWAVDPGARVLRVEEPPANMVLVWDTSGSMDGNQDQLRDAVLAYLSEVRPTERLNLIRFSDDIEVLLEEFTSDPKALAAVATPEKFYPDGGTRFYDAVDKAIDLLKEQNGNRAIVILSDGEDSLSRMSAPAFMNRLRDERIRVYTVGLGMALKGFATRIGSTGQRFMGHTSYITNGRTFHARDAGELKAVYGRIAAELREPSRYTLSVTSGAAMGRLSVTATGDRIESVSAPARVQLVLDASGSMNRRIGNRRMIDMAKDTLTTMVQAMPDNIQVGLRVYGHRVKEGTRGDCEDSQQVQPIGKLNRPALLAKIAAINALGTTPIAYSLQQVGRDLASGKGEQMVVLVTDGREECKGDPKAAVAALQEQGLKVRVNIVGFALTDAAVREQMADIAKLTGGVYFNAADEAALKNSIEQAMSVPYEVLDSAGERVASGQVGATPVQVPEGRYSVVIASAGAPLRVSDVRVVADKESRVELKKEGREVGVKVTQP